jgi:flagellar M-ring protein FliF
MGGLLITIRNWWDKADRNQRVITLGGGGLLILLLLGTFLFASRPHYALLYTDMSEADKGAVVAEIQTMGLTPKYDVPGQIEVPADKLEEISMHLASSGKLPKSVHLGLDGLDKMNLMTTPAQEKVRLQSMLEGELAKTIETLEGVQAAHVHLTPGDDSPFAGTHKPATASVTITESGVGHLTAEQGRAIATLLRDSIQGLELQDISVLNQRMEFLFNGQDQGGSRSVADTRFALEDEISHRRARELQGELDQVFGAGSTVVSVHTELDLDSLKTESTTQNPTDPITSTKISEKMTGASGKALGVSGQSANTAPSSKDGSGNPNSLYQNTNETVNRGVNEIVSSTEKTPGSIKSLVINVIADSSKITDAKQTALRSALDGEVKNHAADAQTFATNLTFVAFDTTSAADASKAANAAASQSRTQQIVSLLPIGALLLIALMVMKQISKFAKAQTAMIAMADGSTMSVSLDSLEGFGGHSGEANAANILAALEGHGGGLVPGDGHGGYSDPAIDVEDIKNKIHMPLEQLKKMAGERPQVVAMLIKSLLLEDRR